MLTIETPQGLVNWSNYDRIYVKKAHKVEDYEYRLIAEKHVGDNEDFGWSEPTLCGGSEAHCNDMLGLIADALRSNANVVTIRNGEPKPDHEPEPDMGYDAMDAEPKMIEPFDDIPY